MHSCDHLHYLAEVKTTYFVIRYSIPFNLLAFCSNNHKELKYVHPLCLVTAFYLSDHHIITALTAVLVQMTALNQ